MFVQVVQARTKDPEAIRAEMKTWDQKVKPKAIGFLGSTAGVADDGTMIVAARFESQEAAQQNSNLPEQSQWWNELSRHLEGEPAFYDCTDVDTFLQGGSDDAGFVQVIQGYAKDVQAVKSANKAITDRLKDVRPEVIGGFCAWGPNNGFSEFVYFTSEAEARKGERKPRPDDLQETFDEYANLVDHIKYIDLREPWFTSK